jgi:hypothetical protein
MKTEIVMLTLTVPSMSFDGTKESLESIAEWVGGRAVWAEPHTEATDQGDVFSGEEPVEDSWIVIDDGDDDIEAEIIEIETPTPVEGTNLFDTNKPYNGTIILIDDQFIVIPTVA